MNLDGSSYKGQWKEDKEDGIGTKTNKNSVSRDGEWDKGNRKKWTSDVRNSNEMA